MTIETQRLTLKLQSIAEVHAQLASMTPEHRTQVSPDWLERMQSACAPDPWWHGFGLVLRESGHRIGSAGFKGPPDAHGVVEIAYGIEPEYEGRGYATEAAAGLVSFALNSGQVRIVRAHTLAEANASARVLSKCGFRRMGEILDPEDGRVWRWERSKEEANGQQAN